MSEARVKAFVLCDEITENPHATGQKDLRGAGLAFIRASTPFPIKRTFWVYLEVADQKMTGQIQLAIMRADSGRRLFFRKMLLAFRDPLHAVPEDEATQDELNRRMRKPGEPGYCPPVKKKDAPPRQQADTEADPTTGAKKS